VPFSCWADNEGHLTCKHSLQLTPKAYIGESGLTWFNSEKAERYTIDKKITTKHTITNLNDFVTLNNF